MKKLCAMLLSLALLCALLPAQAGAYRLGDTIADFSVSTPDGETLSLQALCKNTVPSCSTSGLRIAPGATMSFPI